MGQVCKKCNKTNDKAQLERDGIRNNSNHENENIHQDEQPGDRPNAFLSPAAGSNGLRASYDIDLVVSPKSNDMNGPINDRSNYSVPDEDHVTYKPKGHTILNSNPNRDFRELRGRDEFNPISTQNNHMPDVDLNDMHGDVPLYNPHTGMPLFSKPEDPEVNSPLELPKYIEPFKPIDTGLKAQPSNAEENINFSIGRLQKKSTQLTSVRSNHGKWLQVVQVSQWPFQSQDEVRYYPVVKLGSKREEALMQAIQDELYSDPMDGRNHRREERFQEVTISVTVEIPGSDSMKYFKYLEIMKENLDRISPYFMVASTISERGAAKVYCNRMQVFTINKPEDLQGEQVIDSIKKAITRR